MASVGIPLTLRKDRRTEGWRRDEQQEGAVEMQPVTGRCCYLWSYRVTLLPTFRLSSPAALICQKNSLHQPRTLTSSPEADVVTIPCCLFSILCLLSLSVSLSYHSACCPPPLLQCTQPRTGAMLCLYILTSMYQNYIISMDTDETKNFLSGMYWKMEGKKNLIHLFSIHVEKKWIMLTSVRNCRPLLHD